mgnify:CR=1 FL=1
MEHAYGVIAKMAWESNPENHGWLNRPIKTRFENRKTIEIYEWM